MTYYDEYTPLTAEERRMRAWVWRAIIFVLVPLTVAGYVAMAGFIWRAFA